jgi:hypothetical protein
LKILSYRYQTEGRRFESCHLPYGKCSSDGRTSVMKFLFSLTYPFFLPV